MLHRAKALLDASKVIAGRLFLIYLAVMLIVGIVTSWWLRVKASEGCKITEGGIYCPFPPSPRSK